MTHVFISYSRRDLAFVEQLAADLQATGLDVWYDLSGLEGGARWRIGIEKAIQESQFVIVVLSPDSVASEWVEREYLYATNLGKKILPLFYKACDLPLYYLNVHFIDVQGINYKRNYKEILRALVGNQVEFPTPEPKKAKNQIIMAIVATIIIIIAGVFGLLPLIGRPENTPEPTVPLATKTKQVPNSTETVAVPTKPSSAPTEVFTPTATPFPAEITDDFGVEMVLVPAGEFTMGTSDGANDEKPSHLVYLDAFYIDKYEVTNESYMGCVNVGVCRRLRNTTYYDDLDYRDYPAVYVDWNMANIYCDWREANLPTEAQWEKAARGESGPNYPWDGMIACNKVDFYSLDTKYCVDDIVKAGSSESAKSPYGVYDLMGNAWEWVADWYSETYYQNSPTSNPFGPTSGENRVLRGGLSFGEGGLSQASNRASYFPGNFFNFLGFRCAKDAAR